MVGGRLMKVERVLVAVVFRLQPRCQAGYAHARDFGETAADHADMISVAVRRVPLRRRADLRDSKTSQVVFDQFFQRRIRRVATARLGQRSSTAVAKQIADRGHRDVGMILETERGAKPADAIADDTDSQLAVGDGLPTARSVRIVRRRFQSLMLLMASAHGSQEH